MLLVSPEGSSLPVFFTVGVTVHEFDSVFFPVHNLKEKLNIVKVLDWKVSHCICLVNLLFAY
jgi:hypothetical protein